MVPGVGLVISGVIKEGVARTNIDFGEDNKERELKCEGNSEMLLSHSGNAHV